ncbi:MAG: class I SAM-dependent methyltransferase [Acidobacteria bacterium]|nr:MAG: class I SAM-dependent methyltransferase [Acidobacteriota bacterium]REK05578.1 MAG: class I SAM-dependent methyltransferase [Acidobacteriota bacterium]
MGTSEQRESVASAETPAGGTTGQPMPIVLAYRADERHPTVERFLRERWSGDPPLLDIGDGDEMFDYALAEQHQHRGLALLAYLRSGLTAAETLGQVLERRWATLEEVPSLLDFAAGWGRVTRFLAPRMPGRISVAEISPRALAFQRDRLGVEVLASQPVPERFTPPRTYAAVSAFSLFTHLPERTFGPWLERLWSCVAPGGLLVFSTNGEEVLMGDAALDERGFCFQGVSENRELALGEYGTTWAARHYVASAVGERCRGALSLHHAPRALWHFQDLWVVARADREDEGAAASSIAAPEIAPLELSLPAEGYLDVCIQKGPGRVEMGGWAIDRSHPDQPPEITVDLEGHAPVSVPADRERGEVAALLGERYRHCGWQVALDGGRFDPAAQLLVSATTRGGRRTLLHLSALEGADLVRRASGGLEETRAANLHLRAEASLLEERIAWMQASRFWKLRNAWFRLRGRSD